jgi:1-acyl-sn-glycerol-3-phosphate acyltransferase
MTDPSIPMPPLPQDPATADEIATIQAWVDAGLPAGTCLPGPPTDGGTGGNPYGQDPICTSNVTWPGTTASQFMGPGEACVTCHKKYGAFLPIFAGTVYPTSHEPNDCNGINGATAFKGAQVIINDSAGHKYTLNVNSAGNFYTQLAAAYKPPYTAYVAYNGKIRAMVTPQTSGDCNACHTQNGTTTVPNGPAAPGRILVPLELDMPDPAQAGWPLDRARYQRALGTARVLSRYFRPEYHGFDVFRRPGGMMTVSNHGLFGVESASLLVGIWDASGRAIRGLGDRVLFNQPVVRRALASVGGAEGSPENAHLLLTRGEICWACPGGAREALASAKDRYRLFWEGHHGFVKSALRASVPIVPMAVVGSDEVYRQLYDAEQVGGTAFGRWVERTFGPKYVTPLYVGLGILPLPVKLYFFAGEPIQVPDDPALADVPEVVSDLHGRATRAVEALLARGIERRRAEEEAMAPGARRALTRLLHDLADEVDGPPAR